MPDYCNHCSHVGHKESECMVLGNRPSKRKSSDKNVMDPLQQLNGMVVKEGEKYLNRAELSQNWEPKQGRTESTNSIPIGKNNFLSLPLMAEQCEMEEGENRGLSEDQQMSRIALLRREAAAEQSVGAKNRNGKRESGSAEAVAAVSVKSKSVLSNVHETFHENGNHAQAEVSKNNKKGQSQ